MLDMLRSAHDNTNQMQSEHCTSGPAPRSNVILSSQNTHKGSLYEIEREQVRKTKTSDWAQMPRERIRERANLVIVAGPILLELHGKLICIKVYFRILPQNPHSSLLPTGSTYFDFIIISDINPNLPLSFIYQL